jgi:hypothetical protein
LTPQGGDQEPQSGCPCDGTCVCLSTVDIQGWVRPTSASYTIFQSADNRSVAVNIQPSYGSQERRGGGGVSSLTPAGLIALNAGVIEGAMMKEVVEVEKALYEKDPDDYGNSFIERVTNLEFWSDFGEKIFKGDGNPNLIRADISTNPASNLLGGVGAAKGLKWMTKMAKNPDFISSSIKKLGGFYEISVKIANKNGNGFTIWKKYINSQGKTLRMLHDTYDKTNKFIFRKFVNGRERIEVWADGARKWYSKL